MLLTETLRQSAPIADSAELLRLDPAVLTALTMAWMAMAAGTVARLIRQRRADTETAGPLRRRLLGWWLLVVVFSVAVLIGPIGIVLLMAVASGLATHEFVDSVLDDSDRAMARPWAYGVLAGQYLAVGLGALDVAMALVPVGLPIGLAVHHILVGRTGGVVRRIATITWGVMLSTYFVSHLPLLFAMPETAGAFSAGGATNDIAQAVTGRAIGGAKCAPTVSPNKTWAGLVGGIIAAAGLAIVLAPLLTPIEDHTWFGPAWPFAAAMIGLLIALGGMVGDLTVSAVKRDRGVKDMGKLVPGQGGVFDRIDSLTVTAPLTFYLIRMLWP
mgnify:CR=1 FL=1